MSEITGLRTQILDNLHALNQQLFFPVFVVAVETIDGNDQYLVILARGGESVANLLTHRVLWLATGYGATVEAAYRDLLRKTAVDVRARIRGDVD